MGRKKTDAEAALGKIVEAMAGVEWDAQVMNNIADVLHAAGYEIPEPDPARMPPACCPACGKRDELYVHATGVISFEYNAQRHTADTDTERTEHTNDDYTGYCAACKHAAPLDAFGMKLLDWVDDTCDGEDDDGEE